MSQDKDLNKYVGIPWVKGGTTLKGCDCWGLTVIAAKELFDIQITDYIGSKADGKDLENIIKKEKQRYKRIEKPKPGAICTMDCYHIGLCVTDKLVLNSIRTTSSINSVSALSRIFNKLEFYECQKS